MAFASIDEYIAAQPEPAQSSLRRVRSAIRKALPDAEECISYNMPTYKAGGRAVIYFAGWKKHYSIYPVSADLLAALGDDLTAYEVEKGTIRFPLNADVPDALIERIATLRAAAVAAGRLG